MSWEPFGPTRGLESPDVAPAARTPASPDAPGEALAAPAAAPAPLRAEPARGLVVVTCMDARIDPLRVLGLSLGDANVIRNAGVTVSDDVLRSMGAAAEKLGVVRAVLMGHTDCAGHDSDEAARATLVDGIRRVRGAMPDGFGVEAYMYDVTTGALSPL